MIEIDDNLTSAFCEMEVRKESYYAWESIKWPRCQSLVVSSEIVKKLFVSWNIHVCNLPFPFELIHLHKHVRIHDIVLARGKDITSHRRMDIYPLIKVVSDLFIVHLLEFTSSQS